MNHNYIYIQHVKVGCLLVVRIDPLRFRAGCRKMPLSQSLYFLSVSIGMGAHRHGHLPSPGKVEKCYRMKNPISEVSLNGRVAALQWRKTVNDCSSPTISFLYIWVLLYSYFEGKWGGAGCVPQIWDRETNASCPQILTYTQACHIAEWLLCAQGN